MSIDTSFLFNKQLVYTSFHPLPFCIYTGMIEEVYLVGNAAAMSTMYSPGVSRVLKAVIAYLSSAPLIVDDLLGTNAGIPGATYRVWTTKFIDTLISLNRITWDCLHKEEPMVFADHDLIAFLPPAAFLMNRRLESGSSNAVDIYKNKWFILPAGDVRKCTHISQYMADVLSRNVYLLYIPAATVDSCWVIVAPEGESLTSAPFASYISHVPKQVQRSRNEHIEKMLYEGTTG